MDTTRLRSPRRPTARQAAFQRLEKLMFVGHHSGAFAARSERNSGSMRICVTLLPSRRGRKNFKIVLTALPRHLPNCARPSPARYSRPNSERGSSRPCPERLRLNGGLKMKLFLAAQCRNSPAFLWPLRTIWACTPNQPNQQRKSSYENKFRFWICLL